MRVTFVEKDNQRAVTYDNVMSLRESHGSIVIADKDDWATSLKIKGDVEVEIEGCEV